MNKILANNRYFLKHDLISYFSKGYIVSYYNNYKEFIRGRFDMKALDQLTIDLVHNEIIDVLENNSNKDFINYIRSWYTKFFDSLNFFNINDILLFYKIDLFKDEYASKLFDKDTYNRIRSIKVSLGNNVKRAYESYLKDPNSLRDNELDLLFSYMKILLYKDDNISKERVNNVIKLLIDNKCNRVSANIFLYEYINKYKCDNKHINPALIYISNTGLYDYDMGESFGVSHGNTGIITMSRDLSITDKFDKINQERFLMSSHFKKMQTVFHELQHYYQWHDYSNDKLTLNNYCVSIRNLFDTVLSAKGISEYKANYYYMEIERNANIVAWSELNSFIHDMKVSSNVENSILYSWREVKYGESYATKADNGQSFERYFYNTRMLAKLIKTNPNDVKKHKILRDYFIENGELISLGGIIKRLCNMRLNHNRDENNLYAIYEDAIYSYIFHPKADTYDFLNSATEAEKKYFYCTIGKIFEKEVRKLKNMMDYHQNLLYKSSDQNEIERDLNRFDSHAMHIIPRVRMLYDYIMSLPDDILSLCPEINSFGRLDKQYVSQDIVSLDKTRVEECGLENSKVRQEIIDLGLLSRNNLSNIYSVRYGR